MFDKRGEEAKLEMCKGLCLRNKDCVAFSIKADDWCIGCKKVLNEPHKGAVGYKKKAGKRSCQRINVITKNKKGVIYN